MAVSTHKSRKEVAVNRKALRDFHVISRLEAGIELRGSEVKSVRAGGVNLTGSHARLEGAELMLHGMNIAAYEHASEFVPEPERPRRLLLHGFEINKIAGSLRKKGYAAVPLMVYFRRGLVKIEIGLCRGKKEHDKRETLKRREADREARRAVSRALGRRQKT
ncbi:MAG: SsrA-binding protein SmpB [Kiritimatiellia bacterium]